GVGSRRCRQPYRIAGAEGRDGIGGVAVVIFTRKLDAGGGGVAPGRRQRRPAGGAVSVIGPELVVTGNLESTGELQIHGDVEGDVYAARILVSEQARVAGELVADEIIIAGIVQGSVRGNSVTFRT